MNDPANAPRIMAIIVTWNKKEYVLNLLNSLKSIDYPQNALDIVVIDNASSDDTVLQIKHHYPDIKLIVNSENLGGTGGFNTGLKYAFEQPDGKYDYLWLLDNDVLVHNRALAELVSVLMENEDAGVAGSTMMQLDYPYRINEMGAFVDRGNGKLLLNRHMEEIPDWKEVAVSDLLKSDVDRNLDLLNALSYMEVDYVAAASLLVKADVAKQAGLWSDFFIHFDDIEWCMRISQTGKKVFVSAKSLIWHLSAAAKIPTWILYYDNRNLLYLLSRYGKNRWALRIGILRVLLKSTRQILIGKPEMNRLFIEAADDFVLGRMGKKNILVDSNVKYLDNCELVEYILAAQKNNILIPWTIDMASTGLLESLKRIKSKKPEFKVDFLVHGNKGRFDAGFECRFVEIPDNRLFRWMRFFSLRNRYDIALQSEFLPLTGVACLGCDQLYIGDQNFVARSAPGVSDILNSIFEVLKRWRAWMFHSSSF